jgi:Glyoxalase-like domain
MAADFANLFDCTDPHRLARFWADVLGYTIRLPESATTPDVSIALDPPRVVCVLVEPGTRAEGREECLFGRFRFAQPAVVSGAVGVVVAPRGRLFLVLGFGFASEKLARIDMIAGPERLRKLDLGVLGD